WLSLLGDQADNIPGVVGVGEKGACALLKKFQSVEGILKALAASEEVWAGVRNARIIRKSLEEQQTQILMAKNLITLKRHIPLDFQYDALLLSKIDSPVLLEKFQILGFASFIKHLQLGTFFPHIVPISRNNIVQQDTILEVQHLSLEEFLNFLDSQI